MESVLKPWKALEWIGKQVFPDVKVLISFNMGRQPSEKAQVLETPQR